MSDRTAIEWTDATWNPVTGCTEVSPGCDHCYARTFAERFRGVPGHPFEQGFDPTLRPARLTIPLHWRKPRRVFVNSMSDLFHRAVPDQFIATVFAVMAMTPHHTYQVLTKRHGRLRALLTRPGFGSQVCQAGRQLAGSQQDWLAAARMLTDPLPNVWLGVSVESQHWANIRIPALLDTPAAVRWLSCEPLLGTLDLSAALTDRPAGSSRLHWIVAGGESGHRARPMHPDWPRTLRDQCTAANVPFLFKQWGGRTPKTGGRELDGRTWDQYPDHPTAGAA